MRIIYDNIIDALSAASVVASSEDTSFPVENVQDQRLAKRWMSDTGATAQTVTLTLDTFPLYPDSATGTTYISNFATTDGWSGVLGASNMSVLATVGTLLLTATTTSIYAALQISKSQAWATGSTIMIRYSTTTTLSSLQYYNGTSYTTIATQFSDGSGTVASGVMIKGSTYSTLNLVANYPSTAVTILNPLTIKHIYVGDGTYTTTLPDLSGNGNNATVYGAIKASATGQSVIWFDGTNDYLLPPNFSIGAAGASFCAKIKTTATAQSIFDRLGASPNYSYGLWIDSDGSLLLYVSSLGTDLIANDTTATVNDGAWHSVVGVFTPSVSRQCWIDGTLSKETLSNTPASVYESSAVLNIGRRATGAQYFNGQIDDLRIYNRPLSATEISHYHDGDRWLSESHGLVSRYKVDSGYEVNTAAVLGHNLKPGTIAKVQATNNSSDWVTPELNTTLTVNDGAILNFATTSSVYKYWRFYFYGQGSIEIGRLWLGQYLTIDPSSTLDMKVTRQTTDMVVHSRSRQKFATPGVPWRRFDLSFPRTDEDMLYSLTVLHDAVGRHGSFIFCNFDTIRDYVLVEPCYVSLAEDITFTHEDRMGFSYSLVMEEEL